MDKLRLQLRRLDRELEILTLENANIKEKPLDEIFKEIIESTKIYIHVKERTCQRCGERLEIWFFEQSSKTCHRCKPKVIEERIEYSRKYRKTPEYRARRNAQIKERLKTDSQFKLVKLIRGRIGNFLRLRGLVKLKSTREMLGCDYEFLRAHLESQFTDGMSWSNMGKWHIEHRMPLATAKTSEDIVRLNHYTNLRPMWAIDNLRKGTKVYGEA